MSKPPKLKPCPFCGAVPLKNQVEFIDSMKWGAIKCNCGACGPDVRTKTKITWGTETETS